MAAAMLLFLIMKSLLILAVISLFNMVGVALNPGQSDLQKQDAPNVVKLDIAPPGYYVFHAHHKSDVTMRGGGLAVVHRDNLRIKGPINTGLSFTNLSCLLLYCADFNIRLISSSFSPGPILSSFITEFSDLLGYLQLSCGVYYLQ